MRSSISSILSACVIASVSYSQNGYQPGPRTSTFRHVVVIFQENRTPDNLFWSVCSTKPCNSINPTASQYDIQTKGWAALGYSKGINPAPEALANTYDLSHAHSAFVGTCNLDPVTAQCRMDGAVNEVCSPEKGTTCPQPPSVPPPAYYYVDNSKGLIQPYIDLATNYGWANYMFQTNQGPSFPAHQFIFGGTSAPYAGADAVGTFAAENMNDSGVSGTQKDAGCVAEPGTTVQLIDAHGNEDNSMYPCFEHQTIPDILPGPNILLPPLDKGVTWKYYAPEAGATGQGSIWTAPNAIDHICRSNLEGGPCTGSAFKNNGAGSFNTVDLTPSDVLKDIGNCQLANLAWVIPTGQNSDHAKGNDGGGPSWVANIVNAIGKASSCDSNGYWRDTAIIITWDDWGGWYDHEPPTILAYPEGGYQLGFRVPMICVSAYTAQGYINNDRHDFGSILRFIEGNFAIEKGLLGFADSRSGKNDLGDLIHFFDGPYRPFVAIDAPLNASFFVNDKRPATDPDDQ